MNDHIGPYELRGELGRGAMAVVWRAWEPSLRREVALKEAHVPHGTSPAAAAELAERFVREARAVAGLSHPNIVTVFASDVYDGRPVIAMELIEGDTLSSLLDHGPLPISAALAILDQLLDAVGYAHSKGVVHRDIKPDNVFVTSDGRVKLTDFGIAHVGSGTALTQAGTVMGTPGYMAPEQVTGQPVDARADLFAIGVLGYEMLTGFNPFTAGDAHPTTVMYRVLNEPLPDVRRSVPEVPESLAALLAVATQKDPESRFPSADAMRAALRGDVTVEMPKMVSSAATGRRLRPGYLLAGVVAVVAVVAVGLWFFGTAPRGTGSAGPGSGPAGASVATSMTAAVTDSAGKPAQSASAKAVVQDYVSAVNEGRLEDTYEMRSEGYRAMNGAEGFASDYTIDNWYAGGWKVDVGNITVSLAGETSAFATSEILGYENREDPNASTHLSSLVFELSYESGVWRIVTVIASDG